jgi:hypothetical protein
MHVHLVSLLYDCSSGEQDNFYSALVYGYLYRQEGGLFFQDYTCIIKVFIDQPVNRFTA